MHGWDAFVITPDVHHALSKQHLLKQLTMKAMQLQGTHDYVEHGHMEMEGILEYMDEQSAFVGQLCPLCTLLD